MSNSSVRHRTSHTTSTTSSAVQLCVQSSLQSSQHGCNPPISTSSTATAHSFSFPISHSTSSSTSTSTSSTTTGDYSSVEGTIVRPEGWNEHERAIFICYIERTEHYLKHRNRMIEIYDKFPKDALNLFRCDIHDTRNHPTNCEIM